MLEHSNILVIAAHPDDEILGCGGTIAKHVSQGDKVITCIACEGESHRNISQNDGEFTAKAEKILGVKKTIQLGFPDQHLDTIPIVNIIKQLEHVISIYKPNIIYSHSVSDINKDHKILFEAMLVATRPMLQHIKVIYAFDTLSSTEWGYPRSFIPDTWVDISEYLETKLKAMECYKTEIKDYPHPRSLQAIKNKALSTGNQCLMDKAENFMTIRRCIRNDDIQT